MSAVKPALPHKRCRNCRKPFPRFNSLDVVCSVKCAIAYATKHPDAIQRLARKSKRAETRQALERLKPRREHEKEAQRAFNAYIRERDLFEPCICCGGWPKTPSNHQFDAGHYRTTAAAPQLRFNEDNCHRQLVACNRGKSGNAVEYRKRLIVKIGLARVESLENDNTVSKRDIEQLKAIRKEYQVKLRDLRARREMWGAVA